MPAQDEHEHRNAPARTLPHRLGEASAEAFHTRWAGGAGRAPPPPAMRWRETPNVRLCSARLCRAPVGAVWPRAERRRSIQHMPRYLIERAIAEQLDLTSDDVKLIEEVSMRRRHHISADMYA